MNKNGVTCMELIRCPKVRSNSEVLVNWRMNALQTNFRSFPVAFIHVYFSADILKIYSGHIKKPILLAYGLVFDFRSLGG